MVLLLWLSLQVLFASEGDASHQVTADPQPTQVVCEYPPGQSLTEQFESLRKSLESGFSQGFPAQLKQELVASRKRSDELIMQVLETHIENDLEVSGLVQKTLDHLDQYINFVPKVAEHAPKVRDQFVIPLSNVSSLKAESDGCQTANSESQGAEQNSMPTDRTNKYALITDELNRLNNNLYEAQTISPQKFIAYRAELQAIVVEYHQTRSLELAVQIKSRIPHIVNNMQIEIESLLPSFELSSTYLAIVSR